MRSIAFQRVLLTVARRIGGRSTAFLVHAASFYRHCGSGSIQRTLASSFDERAKEHRLPSRVSGLTSVKTLDRQAVSGAPTLFFVRELRNYLEGSGF